MSSSGGRGPDGKVYCKHMEEAVKRKSNTSKHPNREFYCCKRGPSDQTKCNFFYWVDDPKPPQLKEGVVHTSIPSAAQPSTPQSSKGGSRAPLITTPSTRRSQIPFVTPNNPPETPGSRRRLEDIEAGLRQRELDHSPTRPPGRPGPSKEPGPSTSSLVSNAYTIPQPPSPVPTEVDCEEEAQPRKTFSFLGLDCTSPEPVTSTIPQEGQPSTPKKRRLTHSTEGTAIQSTTEAVSFGGGLLLTPPQTTRRIAQSNEPTAVSVRVPSRKGKEREDAPPARTQDQDCFSWELRDEDALPLFTLPEDTASISSVSPTIAENVLDYADGMKARVKALSEYMESFDITQASKSLQTMERQRIQFECRDRSQKQRIAELVAEKDELLAEVARLKAALERSEASHRFSLRGTSDSDMPVVNGWDGSD